MVRCNEISPTHGDVIIGDDVNPQYNMTVEYLEKDEEIRKLKMLSKSKSLESMDDDIVDLIQY
jgi:hypothetical protein